jgi:hypothetical protein
MTSESGFCPRAQTPNHTSFHMTTMPGMKELLTVLILELTVVFDKIGCCLLRSLCP